MAIGRVLGIAFLAVVLGAFAIVAVGCGGTNDTEQATDTETTEKGQPLTGTLSGLGQRRCVPYGPVNQPVRQLPDANGFLDVGFESGDFKPWDRNAAVPCRGDDLHGMQIVTAPRREGSYAARFAVSQGDRTVGGHGERAVNYLVADQAGSKEGLERWYAFSVLFPPAEFTINQAAGGKGNVIFFAFHSTPDAVPDGCANELQMTASAERNPPQLKFRLRGGQQLNPGPQQCHQYETDRSVFMGPLGGAWHDFVLHIRWSQFTDQGIFEIWHNGVLVASWNDVETLVEGDAATYPELGLYRPLTYAQPSALYADGMKVGKTCAEVAGAPVC
jgi:hypothetical protein